MRLRALAALFALLFAFTLCADATATSEGAYSVAEHPLPANATDIGAMAIDSAGNVWLIQDEPPVLYKFARANATFARHALEGFAGAGFTGLTVDDAGIAWFADPGGNRFGAYSEAENRTETYGFPGPMMPTSVLRRGNTVYLGCKEEVGEWDVRNYEPLVDHFVDRMDSYLYDIHFDRFDNVWFVEYARNRVGVYWRMYDKTSEWAIPTNNSYPNCLSIDSLGRLWFVESGANKLGMFHTELFNFSEHDLPAVDGLKPVLSRAATVDDAVWLTDVKHGRVLRFYPDEGRLASAALAANAMPTFIAADGNGTLWVYEAGRRALASLRVTDQFGQATPTPTSLPTPTPQPTPTASPEPTKAPGFVVSASVISVVLAFAISCTGRRR